MKDASATIPQHRCAATRKDGAPCRGQAIDGTFCLAHSPAYQERMAEARKKGGHGKSRANRAEKLMPAHLRPVYNLLAQALIQVFQGGLAPQQASAMAALAGAMVKVLTAGELEDRLRTLEGKMSGGTQI
ncbi:MAG: hypothetical protein FJ316_10685 [SAR202 cluster bacterium]|nr:hypothetical protein [SAR202 cluster bacterium]